MVKIVEELQKELEWLQNEFGRGAELKLEWKSEPPTTELPFGKEYELRGEVDKTTRTLHIYDTELGEALHTLRHEFLEYVIDSELIGQYVTLYNQLQRAYEKAFEETAYAKKEAFIELLVNYIEKKHRKDERK